MPVSLWDRMRDHLAIRFEHHNGDVILGPPRWNEDLYDPEDDNLEFMIDNLATPDQVEEKQDEVRGIIIDEIIEVV